MAFKPEFVAGCLWEFLLRLDRLDDEDRQWLAHFEKVEQRVAARFIQRRLVHSKIYKQVA